MANEISETALLLCDGSALGFFAAECSVIARGGGFFNVMY
jgi:hypothetical protein